MEETWTQRADKVLALMAKVPSGAEGSPEKDFQRAVWSLCQKLKDGEAKAALEQFIGDYRRRLLVNSVLQAAFIRKFNSLCE